jgi:hypothetical protein
MNCTPEVGQESKYWGVFFLTRLSSCWEVMFRAEQEYFLLRKMRVRNEFSSSSFRATATVLTVSSIWDLSTVYLGLSFFILGIFDLFMLVIAARYADGCELEFR